MQHNDDKSKFLDRIDQNLARKNIVNAHLPISDIGQAKLVCKSWNRFFNQTLDWRLLIVRDFLIPLDSMKTFVYEMEMICGKINIDYQRMYRHLHQITKMSKYPEYKSMFFIVEPARHWSLLACCLNLENGEALVRRFIPADEAVHWFYLCIAICANHMALFIRATFQLNMISDIELLTDTIVLADNNDYLLNHLHEQISVNARPSRDGILKVAAKNGARDILRSMILTRNEMRHEIIVTTLLQQVAESGDLTNLQFVYSPEANLIPKPKRTKDLAVFAAKSGKLGALQFMLDPEFTKNRSCNQAMLDAAASSGNLAVFMYVLNYKQHKMLMPTLITLNNAAKSYNTAKSIEIVMFLLDPKNGFNLTPTSKL